MISVAQQTFLSLEVVRLSFLLCHGRVVEVRKQSLVRCVTANSWKDNETEAA